MRYTIVSDGVPLGIVDLPSRLLTAAHVYPLAGYKTVEPTIRRATEAILEFGLFGIAAPRVSPLSMGDIRGRLAFRRAARLDLALIAESGEAVPTTFLNLLQAPGDGGVIAVASFMEAPAHVGALRMNPPDEHRDAAEETRRKRP